MVRAHRTFPFFRAENRPSAGRTVMPSRAKDDTSNRGQISPEDRAEIRGRAEDLGRSLQQAQADEHGSQRGAGHKSASPTAGGEGLNRALRVSTEMVAGVLVGAGIGWVFDRWLGTWPAFFIVFFLLGSAAGMLNVVRAGMKMKTGPSDPSKGPSVPDDDD